jgi:hypothetical protein
MPARAVETSLMEEKPGGMLLMLPDVLVALTQMSAHVRKLLARTHRWFNID